MIVVCELVNGKLWSAPGLTHVEAAETAAYWRRLGLTCDVIEIDSQYLHFKWDDEEDDGNESLS